jgi:hypothetical protein
MSTLRVWGAALRAFRSAALEERPRGLEAAGKKCFLFKSRRKRDAP